MIFAFSLLRNLGKFSKFDLPIKIQLNIFFLKFASFSNFHFHIWMGKQIFPFKKLYCSYVLVIYCRWEITFTMHNANLRSCVAKNAFVFYLFGIFCFKYDKIFIIYRTDSDFLKYNSKSVYCWNRYTNIQTVSNLFKYLL